MTSVDDYIRRQVEPKPSRSEAIGQLIEKGLAADRHKHADAKVAAKKARDAATEQPSSKRAVGAARAKELAVGAVREALAKVDAPDDVKMERKRKLVAPPATGTITGGRVPKS